MPVAIDLTSARDRLGLATRLRDVPITSTVRGVWFAMAADHIRRLGRAETVTWRTVVDERRRYPFLSYPLREYLDELAIAGAIIDPKDPGGGIRAIWRDATAMYLATPFGRSLVRLLKPNPVRYMRWLADHRDHFCNYGEWSIIEHNPNYVTIEMTDEFIWLET